MRVWIHYKKIAMLQLQFHFSGVASSISEGDIFIYLCSAQLTSFEIDLISKEINCTEQASMNMFPSLIELATSLFHFKIESATDITIVLKV